MEYLLISILLLSLHLVVSSLITEERISELLDDSEVEIVGLHLQAYTNSHYKEKNWATCSFCVEEDCPDFMYYGTESDFGECPKSFQVLADSLFYEYNSKEDWEAYFSEFIGFRKTRVQSQRRIFYRHGIYKPFSEQKGTVPLRMDLTQMKLKLQNHENLFKLPRDYKGLENSWHSVPFNGSTWGYMVFGEPRWEEWNGNATELMAILLLKEGVTRKDSLYIRIAMDTARKEACECIKSEIELGATGLYNETVETCAQLLEVDREEYRPTAELLTACVPKREQEAFDKGNIEREKDEL